MRSVSLELFGPEEFCLARGYVDIAQASLSMGLMVPTLSFARGFRFQYPKKYFNLFVFAYLHGSGT